MQREEHTCSRPIGMPADYNFRCAVCDVCLGCYHGCAWGQAGWRCYDCYKKEEAEKRNHSLKRAAPHGLYQLRPIQRARPLEPSD